MSLKINQFSQIIIALLLCTSQLVHAQKKLHKSSLNTEILSDLSNKVFIESKGQYNDLDCVKGSIKFGILNPGEHILFTPTGVNIVYATYDYAEEKSADKTPVAGKEKEHEFTTIYKNMSVQWQGANTNVKIISENISSAPYYFRHPEKNEPYKCAGFQKITYKNLYDGIDVEYFFHAEQGLKYNFIVHPGADISQIKMKFDGVDKVWIDAQGNLRYQSQHGEVVDHAPVSFIQGTTTRIQSNWKLNGNEASFSVGNYPAENTLVIDPWMISPGFTNNNSGYDLAIDPVTFEIFVYGGTSDFQMKKFDDQGVIDYTYIATLIGTPGGNYYGDMTCDTNGDVYISSGCCNNTILKINGDNTNTIWQTAAIGEVWRLKYNPSNNMLVGAGYFYLDYIGNFNSNTGALVDSDPLIIANELVEIRSLELALDNANLVTLHVSPYLSPNPQSNRLAHSTAALSNNWNVASGYVMEEGGSYYADADNGGFCPQPACFHGFNGLAVNQEFVYSSDGETLFKRDVNNGNELASVVMPTGDAETNSGCAADSCGNVYVGTQNEVRQYDADLNLLATYDTEAAVYDIMISPNGEVIVSGDGFLMSIDTGGCGFHITTELISPLCNGDCNGSIIAEAAGGEEPYEYIWNPGNIENPSIEDLCEGLYSITVIDAAGDTVALDVFLPDPEVLSANISSEESSCGTDNGSATAVPTGGTAPYDYAWSPGNATTQTINSVDSGNYSVEITDDNGCSIDLNIEVPEGAPPSIDFGVVNPECPDECTGQATATGTSGTPPYAFEWDNDETSATISNLCAGSYECTVTDNFGCTDDVSVEVQDPDDIQINTTLIPCNDDQTNASLTASATGGNSGYNYVWLTDPIQQGPTADELAPGEYILVITDNLQCVDTFEVVVPLCPHDSLFVYNIFTPDFTPDADSTTSYNNEFFIYNTGYHNITCEIFNRWGNMVADWQGPTGSWDGKVGNDYAAEGVYYYIWVGEKIEDGIKIERTGYFHLVASKE